MTTYLWIGLGCALGGMARYAVTRWSLAFSSGLPWGTILANVLGSFAIGFVGTYTLAGTRHAASENIRLFLMVGIFGGFTTFSSFSLQTFDLMREGAWARALTNALLSVALSLIAVGLGHTLAQHAGTATAIAQTDIEEGMEI